MASYQYIYLTCLILSIILCGIYLRIHSRQHDIHYLGISILLIIVNYSLYAFTQATSVDSAFDTYLFYYAIMVFIPPSMLRLNASICKIEKSILIDINYLIATIICILILTTKQTNLFMASFDVDFTTGVSTASYGVAMDFYNAYVFANIVLLIVLALLSKNKEKISIRCYFYSIGSGLIFFLSAILTAVVPGRLDYDPIASVIMQVILIILSTIIPLYDVESVITESLEKYGKMGIIIFDKKRNLLGYDKRLGEAIPDFKTYRIDRPLPKSFYFYDIFNKMIDDVDASDEIQSEIFEYDENYYQFEVSKLLMNNKFSGYQLTVTDVTTRQQYIKLIENFNTKLEEEVNNKTKQITDMQNKVILGIAEIIESRDNSTGGHIKRTSKLVEILSEELKRENIFDFPDNFYTYLISAAQMHDLGKVAVPDSILNKPGKFTPEEYEQMKEHAAKGGDIVSKVLEELNNPEFIKIASNVAHYHHERWDGNGYPDKLSGEAIPIEARIMAIADVYDALVSKRVYKDQFDFRKAYDIIMEGMGSQFDPHLKTAFESCVPLFEKYYE